jgi:hypothetical protein
MNDNEKQFEDFVNNIKFDDTPDPKHRDKLEQNLLCAMAKQPRQIKIWKIIMKSPIIKLAAAAVVIIGLICLVSDGQKTLYAQVVKAFEQAHSIHVVINEYRDRHWFKGQEIWYDREEGIHEEERFEDQTQIRIDDKQYEWRYTVGDKLVAKISSYRDPDEWSKDLYKWLRFNPKRNPSGDKVIDGASCDMYTLSIQDGDEKVSVWVNENNRILEFENVEQRGGQEIRSVATIKYDIEIDKSLFLPNFDSNVEIVGPRGLIEEQFPLDTAIFTRKCLGFVFAVHEVKTCEKGLKYIVCSTRLSDKTRQEIGTGHPWTYYGQSDLFDRYDGTYSYDHPILLGRLTHDGVRINWYLLLPSDDRVRRSPGCDVDVRVSTANQLEEKFKAEGLPTNEKFRLNIAMQEFQENQVSLREIVKQVYSLGEKLDPIVHSFLLTQVVTKADGEKKQAWRRPAIQLSEEEYNEDVEQRVQEWLELMGLNK